MNNTTADSPKTATIPLADLVRAAQQGDQIALHQIWQRHLGMLKGVVLAILKNEADTEDVLQESFVKIWLRIGDLNSPDKFSGWIKTIARNKALDFRKPKGPRREVGDPDCLATPDNSPSPLAALIRAEERERVRRAVDTLPEPERKTVTLHYFQDRRLREISGQTGLPIGSVKRHVYTARQRLRPQLVNWD